MKWYGMLPLSRARPMRLQLNSSPESDRSPLYVRSTIKGFAFPRCCLIKLLKLTLTHMLRLIFLTVIACFGGLLFGYDTGFIGSVLLMPGFKEEYKITAENKASISSNCVSTLQAGCFFGALAAAYATDKLGRRLGLAIFGAIFCVGAVIQTCALGNLPCFYVGRVFSGLGVGAASSLAPTYLAEMAPKHIRGKITMTYGFSIFFGIAVSYWVDYACLHTLSGRHQYLVPVALQIVPGAILVLGMIPLKESPRWLLRKGKKELAYKNLHFIRHGDVSEAEIDEEFAENVIADENERIETAGRTWKEMFEKSNRKRFLIAASLMTATQLTGTNAFTYYAPSLFQTVGLSSASSGIFATGLYGIVKAVFSMIWLLFFVEKVGRRKSLGIGAFGLGSCMLIVGCLLGTHPVHAGQAISPASYAMIVFIYVFCVFYSGSWGPVPFTYCAEIFPNRIREYGMTVGVATQWAVNYGISKMIPYAMENIGYRMFIMFAVFNYAAVVYVYFFIKETSGKSLEEMEALFGSPIAIDTTQQQAIDKSTSEFVENLDDEEASVKGPEVHVK